MAMIEVGSATGERRSYEESELASLWRQGKLKPREKYWRPGMTSWRPLFEYFAAPQGRAPGGGTEVTVFSAAGEGEAASEADPTLPYAPPTAKIKAEPSDPRPGHHAYTRDPSGLNAVLKLALGAVLLLQALCVAGYGIEMIRLRGTLPTADLSEPWLRLTLLEAITFLPWLFLIVVFLLWVHRATLNSRGFGAEGMTLTPGWAAASFFIPLAQYVMPYVAVRQIEQVSNGPEEWKQRKARRLVAVWWTACVLSGIATFAEVLLVPVIEKDLALLTRAATIGLVTSALALAVVELTRRVVRGIVQRQEALVASGRRPEPAPASGGGSNAPG